MTNNLNLLQSTSYQWAVTALCAFLQNSHITIDVIISEYEKAVFYAADRTFPKYFPQIPKSFSEITTEDNSAYRLALEQIIQKFFNANVASQVLTCLTSALRTSIIIAAKIISPAKEIKRPTDKLPTKSSLAIPKAFFGVIDPYLSFVVNLINSVDINSFNQLDISVVFTTYTDLLLRRPRQHGQEGTILSSLSQIPNFSAQISLLFQQVAKIQKETPKMKIKFSTLVDNVKCIKFQSENQQQVQTSLPQIKDWISLVTSLKGKWQLQPIINFVSETFIYFYQHAKDLASPVQSSFSMFVNFIFQLVTTTTTEENIQQITRLLIYVSDNDFDNMCPKIYNLLTKGTLKMPVTVYFQYLKAIVEAASIHKGVQNELFNLIINNLFITNKEKLLQINPLYEPTTILMINTFPNIYQMAPELTEEFLVKLIQQKGNTQELTNFILSTLHYISIKTSSALLEPTIVLVSYVRSLIQVDVLNNDEMQLVVPLFPLFWKNCSGLRNDITNLSARLIKSQDCAVLGSLATFFSGVMENSQNGKMPAKLLTQFATQFIKNFDDITSDSILQRNFTFFQSFIKSFAKYSKSHEMDAEPFNQFLLPCETRLLIFSLHPSQEMRNIVENSYEIIFDTFEKDPQNKIPLSRLINAFSSSDRKLFRFIEQQDNYPHMFRLISSFFINVEKPKSGSSSQLMNAQFRTNLASLIFITMKPSYFDSTTIQIRDAVLSLLIPYIIDFKNDELFILVSLADPQIFPLIISELSKHTKVSLPDRLRCPFAITQHIKFISLFNENPSLQEDLLTAFNQFLNSNLPKQESERNNEIAGAQLCSTLFRSTSKMFNKDIDKVTIKLLDSEKIENVQATLNVILRRLNPDSITVPDEEHIFSFLDLLHSFVDTQQMGNNEDMIEDILDWTLLVALKTRHHRCLQLKCHAVIRTLVMNNPTSLQLIMRGCFRSNELTTTHAAAAIASANVSSDDLSILALGLSSRPSILCRSIAAEIANEMAKVQSNYADFVQPFSPLIGLDPFFEEKLANYFSSSLNSENIRKLLMQLPPLLKTTASDPSCLSHLAIIQDRFVVDSDEKVHLLLQLTSIATFADLTPVKPLIPVWDRTFESANSGEGQNSLTIPAILQSILNHTTAINKTERLTAASVAFFRAYLVAPKVTIDFLCSQLQVFKEPQFQLDQLTPAPVELVVSAIISFILSLEEDQERFIICFLTKVHILLLWGYFIHFKSENEHPLLPPLLTTILHAASPNSSLSCFVKAPSECVARAVNLPYRIGTEMTVNQVDELFDALKNMTTLSVELFLDTFALRAPSLSKLSPDFWLLFANYFQPRHSNKFLNLFIHKAISLDIASVTGMLPILTGIVRQNADPSHIGGFATILVSVVSSTSNVGLLKSINENLHVFVNTVTQSQDADMISSTFATLTDEQGGDKMIATGAFNYLIQGKSLDSPEYIETLHYLREIARLFSISGPAFSCISAVLYFFDSIRFLKYDKAEAKKKENIAAILGLPQPNDQDELISIIQDKWIQNVVHFLINYILNFVAKTENLNTHLKMNLLETVRKFTNNWTLQAFLTNKANIQTLLAASLIGTEKENSDPIVEMLYQFVQANGDKEEMNLVKRYSSLRHGEDSMKFKSAVQTDFIPSFIDISSMKNIKAISEYIQQSILS